MEKFIKKSIAKNFLNTMNVYVFGTEKRMEDLLSMFQTIALEWKNTENFSLKAPELNSWFPKTWNRFKNANQLQKSII